MPWDKSQRFERAKWIVRKVCYTNFFWNKLCEILSLLMNIDFNTENPLLRYKGEPNKRKHTCQIRTYWCQKFSSINTVTFHSKILILEFSSSILKFIAIFSLWNKILKMMVDNLSSLNVWNTTPNRLSHKTNSQEPWDMYYKIFRV